MRPLIIPLLLSFFILAPACVNKMPEINPARHVAPEAGQPFEPTTKPPDVFERKLEGVLAKEVELPSRTTNLSV